MTEGERLRGTVTWWHFVVALIVLVGWGITFSAGLWWVHKDNVALLERVIALEQAQDSEALGPAVQRALDDERCKKIMRDLLSEFQAQGESE